MFWILALVFFIVVGATAWFSRPESDSGEDQMAQTVAICIAAVFTLLAEAVFLLIYGLVGILHRLSH